MLIEWDVAVAMRDGARVFVDIFRSEHSGASLLPIILTYSSYGKHSAKTFVIFPNSGVPRGAVSKYTAWEGVDPLYWTARGYAVINADIRGSWGSDGDLEVQSPQEGQDGYDIVEWAAALETLSPVSPTPQRMIRYKRESQGLRTPSPVSPTP